MNPLSRSPGSIPALTTWCEPGVNKKVCDESICLLHESFCIMIIFPLIVAELEVDHLEKQLQSADNKLIEIVRE